MRGDTGDEESTPNPDRFAGKWDEIVSALPELADLDVEATAESIDESHRPRRAGLFGKSSSTEDTTPEELEQTSIPFTSEAMNSAPGPRDWVESELEDADRFIPPVPERLTSRSALTTLYWIIFCISPAALVGIAIFWQEAPRLLLYGIGVLFIATCVALIWRRPARRRVDELPEDGAVV